MLYTGEEIYTLNIVRGGPHYKQDDNQLPSYGVDGCGVTIRGHWLQLEDYVSVPAGTTISVKSRETIHIPSNAMGLLKIKSTYARAGFMMFDSPIDPGYEGTLTLRMFNSSQETQRVYTRGGIAMLIVYKLSGHVPVYQGRHR